MNKIFLLFLICCTGLVSNAQYDWEVGLGLGGSNYLGDIGGKGDPRKDFVYDMKLSQTKWAVSAYVRRKLNRSLSFNLTGTYARIGGKDSETTYAPRMARNLNFRNDIKELSMNLELTIYSDNDFGGRGLYNPNFRIYGFTGIGAFAHSPKGQYDGNWYDLRQLKTEAQAVEYDKFGLSIPAGIGFYFTYVRKYRIGWNMGYRFTFTDYIDDISTVYAYESELSSQDAINLANQTTPEVIEQAWPGEPGQIYNYEYNAGQIENGDRNQRGIETNNDGYLFMQVTGGFLIQESSRSFKMKRRYNWLKSKKKRKRKSRAKF